MTTECDCAGHDMYTRAYKKIQEERDEMNAQSVAAREDARRLRAVLEIRERSLDDIDARRIAAVADVTKLKQEVENERNCRFANESELVRADATIGELRSDVARLTQERDNLRSRINAAANVLLDNDFRNEDGRATDTHGTWCAGWHGGERYWLCVCPVDTEPLTRVHAVETPYCAACLCLSPDTKPPWEVKVDTVESVAKEMADCPRNGHSCGAFHANVYAEWLRSAAEASSVIEWDTWPEPLRTKMREVVRRLETVKP